MCLIVGNGIGLGLCFELVFQVLTLCVDVRCYILYYTLLHIYYYTIIILHIYYILYIYYILSYTILFSSSVLFFLYSSSYLLFCLYIILYLIFSFSSYSSPIHSIFSSFPSSHLSSINSFYTCRYLHTVIYVPFNIFQISDPAQIIGGMSRVVQFYLCGVRFWCGVCCVSCWCDGLTLGGILYYYYYTYTIIILLLYIISYTILSYILLFSSYSSVLSSPLLLFLPYQSPSFLSSHSSTSHSFYTCRYLHILIYILLFLLPFPLLFNPLPSPPNTPLFFPFLLSHSFYTCRYLHILIYIPNIPNPLLFNPLPLLPLQSQSSSPHPIFILSLGLKGIHLSNVLEDNTSIQVKGIHLSLG